MSSKKIMVRWVSIVETIAKEVLLGMRFLGYEDDCLNFVRISFVKGEYVYDRLPNRDDFNGISQSVLDVYLNDLYQVLADVNKNRAGVV